MEFFDRVFGRSDWGLVARRDFFACNGRGGGGVVGPKEWMGWVGEVIDGRDYTPPTPLSTS